MIARARVLWIDGAAELVVTDSATGQSQRFELAATSLAHLVETGVAVLTNQLRTDVRLATEPGSKPAL
jgi:hypothetical protein